ncbi:CRISPR-associated endonuclease Cas1 [Brevibacillus composti]|uniref:CRISPR-associated endonuclease Cas1 n=1 Tax=Brevibacillus composti TaxID=2796470 RepID=A0A7T5ELH7_9BACL|nr:CRISPR-associated endonuclease Cas1 [Brevibacillus composti]QQE74750.1 CRISPR-associated endonuclease Cas1 [Brevibacillus composti]QUO41834.1 CRISPR-associated endonuclease Cas1 [Brevibacillus composti]
MSTIPIRMLNEVQYCERLFYIMHVQGLFEDSVDTIEGTAQHRRAEMRLRKGEIAPEELWGNAPFSLHLGDEQLGIVGKLDTVSLEDNQWSPVEAKHSSSPDASRSFFVGEYELSGSAWPNDQIQLCAQGMLLRSNGYRSDYGFLYYRGNKRKVKIEFTEELVKATQACIDRAKIIEKSGIPGPLQDSNKCFRCSMNYVCLPDETNYLLGTSTNIRKIVPDRSDGGVLYVMEHGARLGKSGESLTISYKDGRVDDIPIKDLVHVTLMGNVQCSTQLLHFLMACGVSISYLSSHGKLVAVTTPPVSKNIGVRKNQFIKFQHPEIALKLARWIVQAKIANQRTLIRRNGNVQKTVLHEMKELQKKAEIVESLDSLRGIEGRAGRLYMQSFPTMLKKLEYEEKLIMNGRNRRPPKDPVNALLSLGYTLLARDVYATCVNVGLDPLFGFYHSMEPGRPSLALDIMEPFRPLIVDSVVLRVLNTGEVQREDFYWGPDSCQLKKNGRKAFFAAYERRMQEMLTHPSFGYKISYRRTLELETRMVARYLDGELPEYRPLITR